jgi:hypothetical protein
MGWEHTWEGDNESLILINFPIGLGAGLIALGWGSSKKRALALDFSPNLLEGNKVRSRSGRTGSNWGGLIGNINL